jgi:CRISPR-associated protein Cas1
MSGVQLLERLTREVSKHTWYKVRIGLLANISAWDKNEHHFAIFQDIIDCVFQLFDAPPSLKVLFHVLKKDVHYRFKQNEALDVELLFFRCRRDHVSQWLEEFTGFLALAPKRIPSRMLESQDNSEGFALVRKIYSMRVPFTKSVACAKEPSENESRMIGLALWRMGLHNECFSINKIYPIEERTLSLLMQETGLNEASNEVCLKFHAPFSSRFSRLKGLPASHINEAAFVDTCRKRLKILFGIKIDAQSESSDYPFRFLPFFWKPLQIRHHTPSFHHAHLDIAGYYGNLYIKGDCSAIFPFLALLSEIHAGSSFTCASGYFTLTTKPTPYFDGRLFNVGVFRTTLRDIVSENDKARASLASIEGLGRSEGGFAEGLVSELFENKYVPAPAYAMEIEGKKGKRRIIETLQLPELLLHTVLLTLLHRTMERSLRDSVIGFRPGMSREIAIEVIRQARIQGFSWVAESDIADFFPSIRHDLLKSLLEQLLPAGDVKTLRLIMQCVGTPYKLNGEFFERKQGLMQGSPLSPLLANLYCAPLDDALCADNSLRYVRYGDDFLILARTRQQAEMALKLAENITADLGLLLKAERTSVNPLNSGVEFLGFRFDDGKKREDTPVNPFKKTLYVARPFLFIGVNGEAVEVSDNKTVQAVVPLRRIGDIVLLEPASISTELLKRCARANVGVSMALDGGYSVCSLAPDKRRMYDRLQRHAGRLESMSESEKLCAARLIVAAKLNNYAHLFESNHANGNGKIIGELRKSIPRLDGAAAIDQMRGIEGAAARLSFEGLNNCIKDPRFHIIKRDRDAGDRINGLLNFGYYLLFTRLNSLCRANGLNPYLGMLHSPENRYESFVCDLQEPFRAFVDQAIIRAVNNGVIGEQDFVPTPTGLYLTSEKRRNFLMAYQTEFERCSRSGGMSMHDALSAQVAAIRRWVDGEGVLQFFLWK